MSNLAYKLDEVYTYADYLLWDTGERCEIIDGMAYAMASPTAAHQRISRELFGAIWEFLKDKPCEVLSAPFDVRLFPSEDNSDTTVVQPDILVVCDPAKLADGKACKGAPDLIIEILSAGSILIDRNIKAEKYRQAGVSEYWIVNTDTPEIQVNRLIDGEYAAAVYREFVPSAILPGLTIDLNTIKTIIKL